MVAHYNDKIDEALTDRDKITKALQAGNPIVSMKDGQMVWLKPEEIQI